MLSTTGPRDDDDAGIDGGEDLRVRQTEPRSLKAWKGDWESQLTTPTAQTVTWKLTMPTA